jgi:2TM domain-containing protein
MTAEQDEDLRQRALKRLKKKRDFTAHVLTYVLVNALLVVIWGVTGAGFFWPIFVIAGWGIAVALNAWDVYRAEPSEEDIRREMERLK